MHRHPICAAPIFLLLANGALAQDAPAAPSTPSSQFLVGAGAASVARYAGADQRTVSPLVLLDVSGSGGFFASTLRGLGYGGQRGPLAYSAALGYRAARKESDQHGLLGTTGSAALKGMGDVEGSATALLSIGYRALPIMELKLAAEIPLSRRTNGKTVHPALSADLFTGVADSVALGLSAGFADRNHAQTYYGVTPAQSGASRFPAYRPGPGPGLYEAGAVLTWQHQVDRRWGVTSMLGADTLLRDAARSPLVRRKTSPGAAIYVSYAY